MSVASHPAMKQCAAVATQQGEMREPPQRKPSRCRKIAASHGCDSMGVNEPPTILFTLRSDVSPHVSSERKHKSGQQQTVRGSWGKKIEEKRKNIGAAAYLCPRHVVYNLTPWDLSSGSKQSH